MTTGSVLVLDSQAQNALGLIRTLSANGLSVTAGGYTRYLPGMLSRHSTDSYVYPDPLTETTAFVDHLSDHLSEHEYDAVFAVTDLTTLLLSKHRERLEASGTAVGAESWDRHLAANDKRRLFEAMEDVDVPTPRTDAPESLEDVRELDERIDYPVVVKPRRTTYVDDDGQCYTRRLSGDNYVTPDENLTERYASLVDGDAAFDADPPLVQEYIDGVETMCTVGLADEGELLTWFQHQKFRVYPPSGGVGAVRQGVREPKMREYAERVVEELEWTGPLHVEFMKTADGEFYLLEVNGRYWGSLALTINSGVDIPWYHYQQLTGTTPNVDPNLGYRTDVKQRKLFYQDILWLKENLSRGNVSALVPFLTSFFTTREEFLDLFDPLPLLGVLPRTAKIFINRQDPR
jgi:predicted ATP-grasp superfamily ATP-dependent carboligase